MSDTSMLCTCIFQYSKPPPDTAFCCHRNNINLLNKPSVLTLQGILCKVSFVFWNSTPGLRSYPLHVCTYTWLFIRSWELFAGVPSSEKHFLKSSIANLVSIFLLRATSPWLLPLPYHLLHSISVVGLFFSVLC